MVRSNSSVRHSKVENVRSKTGAFCAVARLSGCCIGEVSVGKLRYPNWLLARLFACQTFARLLKVIYHYERSKLY